MKLSVSQANNERDAPEAEVSGTVRPTMAWQRALADHASTLREFVAVAEGVKSTHWQRPLRTGGWSPEEIAQHILLTYQMAEDAPTSGNSMRMRATSASAWLSRTLLLPILVRTKMFPRGAPSPPELDPKGRTLVVGDQEGLVREISHTAGRAADGLERASKRQPQPLVTHTYFGPLRPLETIQLLTVHTRHHTEQLLSACV